MVDPHRYLESIERIKERYRKLQEIKEITFDSLESKYSELPIERNLRINISEYNHLVDEDELKEDISKLEEKKKTFEKKDDIITAGEALEILKTAIFNELCSGSLICVRTSEYDDFFNGVDNIIIDKESGEIIAALDEVATIESTERYFEKHRKIVKENTGSGAYIKYGINLDKENIRVIKVLNLRGLPLILISLPENIIWRVVENYNQISVRRGVLKYFIDQIKSLLSSLEAEIRLRERLLHQRESREEINLIQERINKIKKLLEKIDIYE
ncbi:MAG: hypothetical protein NZ866_00925 [Patescibacteria group bacterium]|nr:hypothetical protein [Patescibacteria group bacterium]